MLLTVLMGGSFILLGLGLAWVGIRWPHVSRRAASEQRMSHLEVRLWFVSFTTAGLGFIGMGVTGLRYNHGGYVEVPTSAPLIDHVIWGLGLGGLIGAFILLFWWFVVHTLREKRAQRMDSSET